MLYRIEWGPMEAKNFARAIVVNLAQHVSANILHVLNQVCMFSSQHPHGANMLPCIPHIRKDAYIPTFAHHVLDQVCALSSQQPLGANLLPKSSRNRHVECVVK